jgi:hypothetical protein
MHGGVLTGTTITCIVTHIRTIICTGKDMATGLHKVQVATVNGGTIQATEGMWPTVARTCARDMVRRQDPWQMVEKILGDPCRMRGPRGRELANDQTWNNAGKPLGVTVQP